MRFKGEHITAVLKLLFDDTEQNKKFVENAGNASVQQFNSLIKDTKFELFYSNPTKFCKNLKRLDEVDKKK